MKKTGGDNTGTQEIAAGSCANWYKYFGKLMANMHDQELTHSTPHA